MKKTLFILLIASSILLSGCSPIFGKGGFIAPLLPLFGAGYFYLKSTKDTILENKKINQIVAIALTVAAIVIFALMALDI